MSDFCVCLCVHVVREIARHGLISSIVFNQIYDNYAPLLFLQQPKACCLGKHPPLCCCCCCYVVMLLCYLVVQILAFRPPGECVCTGALCYVAMQFNDFSAVFALF